MEVALSHGEAGGRHRAELDGAGPGEVGAGDGDGGAPGGAALNGLTPVTVGAGGDAEGELVSGLASPPRFPRWW